MEWAFGQPGVVLLASCDLQAARRPREWAAARLLLALRRGSSNSSAGLAGSGLGDSSDPAAPGQKVTRLCLGSSPGAGGGGSRRVNPSRSQAPGGALGPGCEASRPQAGGQTVPPEVRSPAAACSVLSSPASGQEGWVTGAKREPVGLQAPWQRIRTIGERPPQGDFPVEITHHMGKSNVPFSTPNSCWATRALRSV